jgi:hypothetical protein
MLASVGAEFDGVIIRYQAASFSNCLCGSNCYNRASYSLANDGVTIFVWRMTDFTVT